MRFAAVIAGLLACTVIFLTNSPKASAEDDPNSNKLTSTDVITLLDENSLADELAAKKEKKSDKTAVKYTVSEGDTLAMIADMYHVEWERIFNRNENITNPNILEPGITIIIPSPSEKLSDRLDTLQVSEPRDANKTLNTQASEASVKVSSVTNTAGNRYAYGYCTWYAKSRRPDLPNQMGNAISWVANARAIGIPTGSTPRAGAIGQSGNHVVYVERVNRDGTVTISDMNYAGWGVVTTRKASASSFLYIY